jgi:hypothetical protein
MPEDVSGCNKPAARRDLILACLAASNLGIAVAEVRGRSDESLDFAKCVHDPGFIAWLETAWDRWLALEHRDPSFCGAASEAGLPAALVPGNFPNRDPWCQSPGTSVTCQTAFYASDRC